MKTIHPLTLATIVSTLFITTSPLRAADTDDRIESAATKSYVFKTYLKDDAIKVESDRARLSGPCWVLVQALV